MAKLKDLKKRLMADPEFREEYARADDEFMLIEALVRARRAAELTQTELARRLGTTQSAIARLEGGGVSPSFATLRRYAEATTDPGCARYRDRRPNPPIDEYLPLPSRGVRSSRILGPAAFKDG